MLFHKNICSFIELHGDAHQFMRSYRMKNMNKCVKKRLCVISKPKPMNDKCNVWGVCCIRASIAYVAVRTFCSTNEMWCQKAFLFLKKNPKYPRQWIARFSINLSYQHQTCNNAVEILLFSHLIPLKTINQLFYSCFVNKKRMFLIFYTIIL